MVVAPTALVDVATIGVVQERAVREQEVTAGQLQAALNSRVIIDQAKASLPGRLEQPPTRRPAIQISRPGFRQRFRH